MKYVAEATCFTNLFPVDLAQLLEIIKPGDSRSSMEPRSHELHSFLTTPDFDDCSLITVCCHSP